MATKDEVKTAIEAIEDNKNNTAKEVRDVLGKLLEYSDKESNEKALRTFEFNNNHEPVTESEGQGTLIYSFRGFMDFHVNFSFLLEISEGEGDTYLFALPEDTAEVIGKIMNQNHLDFIVPVRQETDRRSVQAAFMNIRLERQDLRIQLRNLEIWGKISVKTSIQFHTPEFFNAYDN